MSNDARPVTPVDGDMPVLGAIKLICGVLGADVPHLAADAMLAATITIGLGRNLILIFQLAGPAFSLQSKLFSLKFRPPMPPPQACRPHKYGCPYVWSASTALAILGIPIAYNPGRSSNPPTHTRACPD